MVETFARLEPLHAAVAERAGEDPLILAHRLVELQQLMLEPFAAAADTHGALLGEEGIALLTGRVRDRK